MTDSQKSSTKKLSLYSRKAFYELAPLYVNIFYYFPKITVIDLKVLLLISSFTHSKKEFFMGTPRMALTLGIPSDMIDLSIVNLAKYKLILYSIEIVNKTKKRTLKADLKAIYNICKKINPNTKPQ